MEKQIDEIELRRLQLIQKHNHEMSEINIGIQMLKIDEVPDAVRTVILDEISYSFNEKCNYYRKEMEKLDNEINELKSPENYFTTEKIMIQCPPGQHRSNIAERSIQTFKNHANATLATADPLFPLVLWDRLLPEMELCLNHLMPYCTNQTRRHLPIQAYTVVHTTSGHTPLLLLASKLSSMTSQLREHHGSLTEPQVSISDPPYSTIALFRFTSLPRVQRASRTRSMVSTRFPHGFLMPESTHTTILWQPSPTLWKPLDRVRDARCTCGSDVNLKRAIVL